MWNLLFLFVLFYLALETCSRTVSQKESSIQESVVRIGTCHLGATLAEIRITSNITNTSKPLITLCHDESTGLTLWSKHSIIGTRLSTGEARGHRPSFKEGGFFRDISADDCYSQGKQQETVGILVGSKSLGKNYIQPENGIFFARGHLAPKGDFPVQDENHATFFYINAAPHWQSINAGNWVSLESQVRKIAKGSKAPLSVWTGSYGHMTLDDVNGNPVEIWLGRDSKGKLIKKLPVSRFSWKVIHDPVTRTGAAIIMINNPWLKKITAKDILCEDICNQLEWVNWNTKDIIKGYTYCCSVKSFREKVNYAPDLGNSPLLKIITYI